MAGSLKSKARAWESGDVSKVSPRHLFSQILTAVVVIAAIMFLASSTVDSLTEDLQGRTVLSECPHRYSLFEISSYPGRVCCEHVMLSVCGVTLVSCLGKVGAHFCAEARCINGDQCNNLPDWMRWSYGY